MLIDSQTLAYAGLVWLLTITPGADTMLVIRNVLAQGRRAGLLTTAGVGGGILIHGACSALGLSVILMRSAALYDFVKLAGAAYLIYLGWLSIRQLFAPQPAAKKPASAITPHERAGSRPFAQGLLTNVLNPKVAVFYLALLPQFIHPDDPVMVKSLLYAGMHVLMVAVWLSLVAIFVGQMRGALSRPRVRLALEGLAGALMIFFGVRLALDAGRG
jgi:RhtB (resistance to homoserine/threonine) family protein